MQLALNKITPMPPTKTSSAQNCTNPFTNNTFRPFLNNCGSKLKELFMSENLMPSFPSVISNVMVCLRIVHISCELDKINLIYCYAKLGILLSTWSVRYIECCITRWTIDFSCNWQTSKQLPSNTNIASCKYKLYADGL